MKKIFLLLIGLFFFAPIAHAKHCWVWTGENINVYVEDSELEWNENGKEFSVTVIDVFGEDGKKINRNKFYFYEREKNWFYAIEGKQTIMPVSKANVSGYILEFAQSKIKNEI